MGSFYQAHMTRRTVFAMSHKIYLGLRRPKYFTNTIPISQPSPYVASSRQSDSAALPEPRTDEDGLASAIEVVNLTRSFRKRKGWLRSGELGEAEHGISFAVPQGTALACSVPTARAKRPRSSCWQRCCYGPAAPRSSAALCFSAWSARGARSARWRSRDAWPSRCTNDARSRTRPG